MTRIYGTAEAARKLGINPKRLKRWVDYGYFQPEYRAALGRGDYRLFSDRDIAILRDILGRIDGGVPLGRAFNKGGN